MAIGIGAPTTCEGCGAGIVAASRWEACGALGQQLVRWWIEWPLAEGEAEDNAAVYDVPKSAIVAHTHERCDQRRAAVLTVTTPVSGSEPV